MSQYEELVKRLSEEHTLDIRDIVQVRELLDLVGKERGEALAAILSLQKENEGLREAFSQPGMMVYLDGRNEHGTHVLPSLPINVSDDCAAELFTDEAKRDGICEEIFQVAEAAGFGVGDLVWTVWHHHEDQRGEFGMLELPGYWEFISVNPDVSRLASKALGAQP